MTNLSLNLTETAAMYPDAIAIRCDAQELSFAELDDAAARFATFLQSEGIEAGDRVGLMLPNIPAFAVVYYGILRIGAVVVPMNRLLSEREVQFYLTSTGASAMRGAAQSTAPAAAGEEGVGGN